MAKQLPEEIVENLLKQAVTALKGRSFQIRKTLSLEIGGVIYPSLDGLEIDNLEVRITDSSNSGSNDYFLTILGKVLEDHIDDSISNFSNNDDTDISELDNICQAINSELETLEADACALEKTLEGVEWPKNDWLDPDEHTELWDAIMDEAYERTSDNSVVIAPLHKPFVPSAILFQKPALPEPPLDTEPVLLAEKPKIEKIAISKSIAATAVKPNK